MHQDGADGNSALGQTAAGDYGRYKNPTVDGLFDQFAGTSDPAKQHDLMKQVDMAKLKTITGEADPNDLSNADIQGDINAANPLSPTELENAEFPPGAVLPVGAPIVFTYLVTNPGTQALKIR